MLETSGCLTGRSHVTWHQHLIGAQQKTELLIVQFPLEIFSTSFPSSNFGIILIWIVDQLSLKGGKENVYLAFMHNKITC